MQIFWVFLNLFPHFVSIEVMPTKDMTYYVVIPTCTKSPTSEVTSQMTWKVLSRSRILRLLYQVGLPTGNSNISTGGNRTVPFLWRVVNCDQLKQPDVPILYILSSIEDARLGALVFGTWAIFLPWAQACSKHVESRPICSAAAMLHCPPHSRLLNISSL